MDPRITRPGPTESVLGTAAGSAGLPAAAPATGDSASPTPRPAASSARSAPSTTRSAPSWRRGSAHRHPWDRKASGETLTERAPRAVGLDEGTLEELPRILRAGLDADPPRFSGVSLLIASRAGIAYEHADGFALRWQDSATEMPEDQWIPARTDTIYDLASISKIFTATAVMQQVEKGRLGLEDRVADHLPRFAENGKSEVTVRHLLSHVGGLPPFIDLCSAHPDVPSRLDAVLTVEPSSAAGTEYIYSDLGLITLGLIVEKLSGQGLDEYVREHITAPLGMTETMYNPPAELKPRIAATEYVAHGGCVVHGHVHDENARSLGGVAGHAGIFSTARDLAVFAQMFLGGGRYGDARILDPGTVQDMFTDNIAEVTGVSGARRGLGPELEAWYYHASLTSPYSGAHTGFTGTSLVIDPLTDTIVVMLANSVHPTREWSTTSVTRREVSTCVAHALGFVSTQLRDGWHAGGEDETTATLSVAVDPDGSGAELRLDLFAHLETVRDVLALEASADQGETWTPLAGRLGAKHQEPVEILDGRITGWGRRAAWTGVFPLTGGEGPLAGEVQIRLVLTTDASPRGLGAWVGRIRVLEGRRELLNTDRDADRARVLADGWSREG